MAYTLELIKDDGTFDKWGAANIQTARKESFGSEYSKLRLFQIAGKWLQDENVQHGEGWVNVYEDGKLTDSWSM